MAILPQLQTSNKTFLGRYWTEHSLLSRYLSNGKNISILSFGCSTGEELISLRTLFPSADLFGCDVDWHNLQAARALLGKEAVIFNSSDQGISHHGPYDIIVCNSVLLSPTTSVEGVGKRGIDPNLWSDIISLLNESLNPGGILQIINSNIPFRCHPVAENYVPLPSALVLGPNFVDQFDLDNNHMCSGVGGVGRSAIISQHLAENAWSLLQPTDLTNVHFFKSTGSEISVPAPINHERIPNLPTGKMRAEGTMSYSSYVNPREKRPSTRTEVELKWRALAVDTVRLKRKVRRYWFDDSIVNSTKSTVDMYGPSATSFIESATGRRSTRLTVDTLLSSQPIRASQF